jgi:two-component system NtrC family sensor kinase
MRTRIGTQAIAGVGLVTGLTIGLMAVFVLRAQEADVVAQLQRSADQLGETIKSSTHYDMLENRRDNLHRQIETIGRQAGIETVRVFNKEGRIVFSSEPAEIGRSVDKQAEACYGCHAVGRPLERLSIPARSRIFRSGDRRILGTINPIQNDASCASAECHAHARNDTVLGVLDVTLSLVDVDRQLARSRARLAALAGAAIAGGSLILWWLSRRLVIAPVRVLVAATRRVAEGDLTATIPVTAHHELGDLARAFNDMTRRLADAQRQLTQADKLASVGRLAAGVAHEINNPLTGVLTYASYLLKRAEADERPETREDLEVIVRETKRCREIVKGLLDFARPTPPRRQPSDLNEVVRRAVSILMSRLALSHVGLRLDLADGLPAVPADPNQIQQVLVNLLVNAADAAGDSGAIHIVTRHVNVSPRGHAVIRSATCPRGCSLLDPSTRIGGHPALRVVRVCGGTEAALHLDPVYGRFNQASAEPCEEGVVAEVHCPSCRTRLDVPDARCARCTGPVFAATVPEHGRVLWCRRNGCHWSHWDTAEEQGPQPSLEVVVEDSGRGISADDLTHLFEPFFTTKGSQGTGLGLAVTWGIVEGHGGTIEVESAQGQGSRFTVRLPLSEAKAEARAQTVA